MEYIREHLKETFGISDETYKEMVEEQRQKSPMVQVQKDMNNIGEVSSAQLSLMNDMGMMVAGLMMKITELEAKLK